MGDKWTLLIIRDLISGPRRFVELQRTLPGISTEQLRSRLNRMVTDGLLTRQRYREVPPRVDYELTERAAELAPVVGALARWGYRWAWGAPRPGEAIHVGAILRASPGMLEFDPSLSGAIECTVEGDRGADRSHLIAIDEGAVSISEQAAENPDARITGPVDAWVAALGPEPSTGGLTITGEDSLATKLLDAFALEAGRSIELAV